MRRRHNDTHRYGGWAPYVPVGERRRRAEKRMKELRTQGLDVQPVTIEGRKIARSFWGAGWCQHMESFGDYENRLPRGRTYVRNGSVCHLTITGGKIMAIVCGSSLYTVEIEIEALAKDKWDKLRRQCTGKIGSLLELLQGKLSDEIMSVVTDRKQGLFPQPGEIKFHCDCPDHAGMCKHIAAAMYGVGARLDEKPELLFLLRKVDHEQFISSGATAVDITSGKGQGRRRRLAEESLEGVFGLELVQVAEEPARYQNKHPARTKPNQKDSAKKTAAKKVRATKITTQARLFVPTGQNIAKMRQQHGMSLSEFAQAVGVSEQSIRLWEAAKGPLKLQQRSRSGLERLHAQWQGHI